MKTDLYNKVTNQIVASLEQGVRPWMQPWSAERRSRSREGCHEAFAREFGDPARLPLQAVLFEATRP